MFNHPLRYPILIALSLFTLGLTLLCEVYTYFQIRVHWYAALAIILFITLLSWEANRLIGKFLSQRIDSNRLRFTLYFFTSGALAGSLISFGIVCVMGQLIYGRSWQENLMPQKLNLIYVGLITLLFHLVYHVHFFFQQYREQLQKAEELKRYAMQSQLQAMRNQLNPHFLFNNLNVLSSLVIKDNPTANKFIEEFARVYRYILSTQEKDLVELNEELSFISQYLFLLKTRFEKGLDVHINIPADARSLYVMPLVLQLLIENAIKHNVVSFKRPLRICLSVDGDMLVIRNNRQPRQSPVETARIGLLNIQRRYELASNKKVNITRTDEEFIVTLPLIDSSHQYESTYN